MQNKAESNQQKNIINVNAGSEGQRIDNFLIKTLKDVGKSNIYKLLRKGQIRINSKRCKPTHKLREGDSIRFPPFLINDNDSEIYISDRIIQTIKEAVLFENKNFLVINKPSGLAAHAGTGIKVGLIEVCKKIYPETEIQLAHRLDRETSGCVVLAKNRISLNEFNSQSKSNSITKTYLALVKGVIKNDFEVELPLDTNHRVNGERTVLADENGKYAKTGFKVSEFYQKPLAATLLQCHLFTGRTHQIRVHAASVEHPLAGDLRYGDNKFNQKLKKTGLKRLFLHASSIEFKDGEETIIVSAPLPDKLLSVLQKL